MYLKELYRHNKGWFIIVILFIVVQLINNIRQDVSISPIYQYGMYSAYIPSKKVFDVFEVKADKRILQPKDFSPQQWDKIILPIRYYANSGRNNNAMYDQDIKRLLNKLHITAESSNFIYSFNEYAFINWYKPYLSSIIKEKIHHVEINCVQYQFDSSSHKIQSRSFTEACK